ncbi:hypothetical protein, partial [Stieleria sp.]|uniref:hypothetical protein n=1 Tax=Stieleria sp. TaxID=2795976 RepID=UPI003568E0AD
LEPPCGEAYATSIVQAWLSCGSPLGFGKQVLRELLAVVALQVRLSIRPSAIAMSMYPNAIGRPLCPKPLDRFVRVDPGVVGTAR